MRILLTNSLIVILWLGLAEISSAAQPGSSSKPASGTEESLPLADEVPEDWEEDPERHRRVWEQCMSPLEYRAALEKTGMADFIAGTGATTTSVGWSSIGPIGNLGVRNYNGRVAGIEIRFNGTDYDLYAGACSGGLWKTSQASLGAWTDIGQSLPNPSVRAFAVSPLTDQHIIVGTGDYLRWPGSGMYYTTNGGSTWQEAELRDESGQPIVPSAFYRVAWLRGTSSQLIAASTSGVFRSSDGVIWVRSLSGDVTDLVMHPTSSQIAYAAVRSQGIFKTTDGGNSWSELQDSDFIPDGQWGRASLAICRGVPNVLSVVVEFSGAVSGVYKTVDSGGDWTDITGTLAGFGSGQMFHAHAIAIKPNDPQRIFVGAVSLAESSDGGSTWSTGTIDVGHADITQLYFSLWTGNDTLWICNDGGIYRHTIGGSTFSLNGDSSTGLAISQIGAFDADRDMRAGGLQDNGVIRSLDGAQSWHYLTGGDGGNVEITDPEALDLWMAAGVPWHPARALGGGLAVDVLSPPDNSCPLFHSRQDSLMYSADSQRLLSRALSAGPFASWTTEIPSLHPGTYSIFTITGSDVDGRTVFVRYRGDDAPDLTICRKAQSSWTVIQRDNIGAGNAIRRIVPSNEWNNECWITLWSNPGSPKILHLTNDGADWTDISGSLNSVSVVHDLAVTPFNPLVIYAATDIGVFRTEDGGQSWSPYQDGMPVVSCQKLKWVADDQHAGNHKLLIATYGRGVWERVIPGPAILYVDQNTSGFEDGTFEHPYDTITEAVQAAPTGATVAVRAGTYQEPQTVASGITIVTYAGQTVIH